MEFINQRLVVLGGFVLFGWELLYLGSGYRGIAPPITGILSKVSLLAFFMCSELAPGTTEKFLGEEVMFLFLLWLTGPAFSES